MSASLVGSEMCIRDRRDRQLECKPQSLTQTPDSSLAKLAPLALLPLFCCLLYTSDAADDM
eukprot:6615527-Alexandrium_andersonii.AAC.1